MLRIIKPSIGLHDGSSFRELLDMWGDLQYCKIIPGDIPKKPWPREETQLIESRPWVEGYGKVLLYDNPILDKLHDKLIWEKALWANTVKSGDKCFPWTFWPKHPKKFLKHLNIHGVKKYEERQFESVFIGSFTTNKRVGNWQLGIQNFWMGRPNDRLFAHEKYLEFLSLNKFGLSLPGVGPKCLRDIELIGLGTVPIFTPGVSTQYFEPLEKDKHFLFANTPQEVTSVIKNCTEDKWNYMSNNCIEWYQRNCSPLGSYKLTEKIVNIK